MCRWYWKQPIVLESNQNHATITNNGICPTLSAAMGMGGGYVPMIVVQAGAGEGGNNPPMIMEQKDEKDTDNSE